MPRSIFRKIGKTPQETRWTDNLVYQHIVKNIKIRKENVAIAWINKKQAYDLVLQTWIIECLKMYKISNTKL